MASVPSEQVVKVRAELDNAVVVRPGDTLVIALSQHVDQATAHAMKARIAETLPGVDAVIIDGASSIAVYQPGEWKPTDDQLTAWLRRNPQWFERWVARYNRIHGGTLH